MAMCVFPTIALVASFLVTTEFRAVSSAEIRLINLEPSEAQQHIERKDASLNYAPKIESAVPAIRFLGEEPYHVLEDKYDAHQYHGQDGLGGYLYGYAVPDIAKTERKKSDGDLRGSYKYQIGNGKEIIVEYWDNGTGFHQTDNLPDVLPAPVDYSPEVKAAREEHFRRWQEEAERNSQPVKDPNGSEAEGSENVERVVKATMDDDGDDNGEYDPKKYETEEDEDSTGPPKGFFYEFNYPVGIIVETQGRAHPDGEANTREKGLQDAQVKELLSTTTKRPSFQ